MIKIDTRETYITIVEEYSDMLFRIAYQNMLHRYDAEDIVQDVLVKLLKNKELVFDDEQHLKNWLIRVTINQCKNLKKVMHRHTEVALEDDIYSFTQEEESIFAELIKLPEESRNILYLYYYEGYSIKEIADIMQKSINTISSRLSRARIKLRKILEEENR